MFAKLGKDARTAVVAAIAASLVAGPSAYAAAYVANADKVDNRHAVGARAGAEKRAGKLVATNSRGFLPNDVVKQAPDADLLDGVDSSDLLPGGVLPSGATIRGAYALIGRAPGGQHAAASQGISFGYQLPSAPQLGVVRVGGQAVTGCPGTADQPEADPGFLCIYEKDQQNKRDLFDYPSVSWGVGGGSTRPFGVHLAVQSNFNEGFFWSRGSWAVTAP